MAFTKRFEKQEWRWITIISHVFNKHDYPVTSTSILAVGRTVRDWIHAVLYTLLVRHCPSSPVSPGFSACQKLSVRLDWAVCVLRARVSHLSSGSAEPLCILASRYPLSSQGRHGLIPSKAVSQRASERTHPAPVLTQQRGNSHSVTDSFTVGPRLVSACRFRQDFILNHKPTGASVLESLLRPLGDFGESWG